MPKNRKSESAKNAQYVQIFVRNARTHLDDGKAQFTDFEIELKTNHIAFTLKNSKVRRRYSDFVWLRNRLTKDTLNSSHPPSLPGRRLFGRFNKDFIKQRQKKLQEFLFGLVENNVYLSHAAIHLFLQSKLSVEDIDVYLDSNQEEDASETILAESEGKARVGGYTCADHDDGKQSDGDVTIDEDEVLNNGTVVENNNCTEDEGQVSDGNNADDESEIQNQEEEEKEEEKQNPSDEEELVEELNKLRMTLPAEPSSDNDQFGSSFDFSDQSSTNESDEDSSIEQNNDTDSNAWNFSQRISSQENVRSYSKRSKPRCFSRNNSFRKLYTSNASLPEFYKSSQTEEKSERNKTLRRSKSFYEYKAQKRNSSRRKSMAHLEKQSSFRNDMRKSQTSLGTPRKVKRTTSLASSMERTPHKRKISLNEYIIVGRDSLLESKSTGENFGKSSL